MRRQISPLEIIAKLRALAEVGDVEPVDEEFLWFLQSVSMEAGGLARVAVEIVHKFPGRVGPLAFQGARGPRLTRKEASAFWSALPERSKHLFVGVIPEAWILETEDSLEEILSRQPDPSRDYPDDCEQPRAKSKSEVAREQRAKDRSGGIPEIEVEALAPILKKAAEGEVERCLMEFCCVPSQVNNLECWAFPALRETLGEWIAASAEEARSKVAQTSVVAKVFDALNFAWEARVMVQIEGHPRHGKTEAISTYCAMHRGRARLITVPSESSEAEFFLSIAEGLGIQVSSPGNIALIRREIDWVLRNARLMLIWDEAHFLVPSRYSESTPPARMNWVRTRVADRGLPAALVITPQSFDVAFRKYIKKTKHTFEQFFGRIARFHLPSLLSQSDILSVAKIHFPDIPQFYLEQIAERVIQKEEGLQMMEFTALRARFLAKREGRKKVSRADIDQAMDEIFLPGKPDAPREKQPCIPVADRGKEPLETAPERFSRLQENSGEPRIARESLLVA